MDRSYVEANDRSFARLQALTSGLSDEQLALTSEAGWTVASIFVHLAFWDRRAARLIERWSSTGYAPSAYDHDAINDAMKPAWSLIPHRAALAEALSAAEEADRMVAGASDELVAAIRKHGGVGLDRGHHRNNHLDEIEAMIT